MECLGILFLEVHRLQYITTCSLPLWIDIAYGMSRKNGMAGYSPWNVWNVQRAS